MAKPRAAGLLLVHDGRVLLLKRAAGAEDAPNCWGFPGGHIEPGETPEKAARREYSEETGMRHNGPLRSLGVTSDGFEVFGGLSGRDEAPELNDEHTEWEWAPFDKLPSPLHPSMKELIDMPSVSEKQRNAMEAAAHGKSTLGIPKKIGEEFVRADDAADPIAQHLAGLHKCAEDCMAFDSKRGKPKKRATRRTK